MQRDRATQECQMSLQCLQKNLLPHFLKVVVFVFLSSRICLFHSYLCLFVFLSSLLDFFFLVCGAGFTLGTQNRLLRITRPNWPSRSYQLLVSNRYVELWRCTQVQFFKAAPKSWRMKRTNSKKLERKGMKLTDGTMKIYQQIFVKLVQLNVCDPK